MTITIAQPGWLYPAYLFNIIILLPVCWTMMGGGGVASVFGPSVSEEPGLRLLVASLWSAILLASVAGLFAPTFFAPLLIVQILYKVLWLGLFVWPLWQAGAAYPTGPATVFVMIVLTYPVLLALAMR